MIAHIEESYRRDGVTGELTWQNPIGGGEWADKLLEHKIVFLDELRGNKWLPADLLRMLDNKNVWIPVKGGFTVWQPDYVVITSSMPPWEIYSKDVWTTSNRPEQIVRRIYYAREYKRDLTSAEGDINYIEYTQETPGGRIPQEGSIWDHYVKKVAPTWESENNAAAVEGYIPLPERLKKHKT